MSQIRQNHPLALLLEVRFGPQVLMLAATLLLFAMLGGREIGSLETRWADTVLHMLASGDYFHPLLKDQPYDGIPLLPYWLTTLSSVFTDGLNLFSLRFSSACAALVAVGCSYLLGKKLWSRQVGLLSGWLLLSCYYFVFWGRVAGADMLTVAGMLAAWWWYHQYEAVAHLRHYCCFATLLALLSLCTGLFGAILPVLCIAPHLCAAGRWRQHLNGALGLSLIVATALYLLPFGLSSLAAEANYTDQGLALVFREKILGFFALWDHLGPVYLYLLYIPFYSLPWSIFLLPALRQAWQQRHTDAAQHQVLWALVLLWLFFTLAGSRHSYDCLPMVPVTLLLIAHYLTTQTEDCTAMVSRLLSCSYLLLFLLFAVVLPTYYSRGGPSLFGEQLGNLLRNHPQFSWQLVLLDVDNKLPIYLPKGYPIHYRSAPSAPQDAEAWLTEYPALTNPAPHHIYITQSQYAAALKNWLPHHHVFQTPPVWGKQLRHLEDKHAPLAFIPAPP